MHTRTHAHTYLAVLGPRPRRLHNIAYLCLGRYVLTGHRDLARNTEKENAGVRFEPDSADEWKGSHPSRPILDRGSFRSTNPCCLPSPRNAMPLQGYGIVYSMAWHGMAYTCKRNETKQSGWRVLFLRARSAVPRIRDTFRRRTAPHRTIATTIDTHHVLQFNSIQFSSTQFSSIHLEGHQYLLHRPWCCR